MNSRLQTLFKAYQLDAWNAVERAGYDAGLAVAQLCVHAARTEVAGVGIHAQHGAALGAGIVFIKGHEARAEPQPAHFRIHHQRVQHHDLIVGGFKAPGAGRICGHLRAVDARGSRDLAVRLQNEEITRGERRLGRGGGGVDAADPADLRASGFLHIVDALVDCRYGGNVRGGCGANDDSIHNCYTHLLQKVL